MPKRMVYFRKNLKTKIRWHSLPKPKVSVKGQSDSHYIFSMALSIQPKAFKDFHLHLNLLQAVEFDFFDEIRKTAIEK